MDGRWLSFAMNRKLLIQFESRCSRKSKKLQSWWWFQIQQTFRKAYCGRAFPRAWACQYPGMARDRMTYNCSLFIRELNWHARDYRTAAFCVPRWGLRNEGLDVGNIFFIIHIGFVAPLIGDFWCFMDVLRWLGNE
jgi:hypothetical protein